MRFKKEFCITRQRVISFSDNIKVVIKAKKQLSEKQKDAIITIARNGIKGGEDLDSIRILIIMNTGIHSPVNLKRIENGFEVII